MRARIISIAFCKICLFMIWDVQLLHKEQVLSTKAKASGAAAGVCQAPKRSKQDRAGASQLMAAPLPWCFVLQAWPLLAASGSLASYELLVNHV